MVAKNVFSAEKVLKSIAGATSSPICQFISSPIPQPGEPRSCTPWTVDPRIKLVSELLNVVGASCKRRDSLREKEDARVREALMNNELQSGKGLHQETSLKRVGDTRWGSHYETLLNLILMFSSVIDVLEEVLDDGLVYQQKCIAFGLLESLQSFGFAFDLILMRKILRITNELSRALQRKDRDIINAMELVKVSKQLLKAMRGGMGETT